jgi:hypothetical protein
MLLLGLGTIGVVTIVTAIATRKLWLIPAVGATVLSGLIFSGLAASLFIGRSTMAPQSATIETLPLWAHAADAAGLARIETVTNSPTNFVAQSGVRINPTWLVIFCVVLGFVVFRRLFCRQHGHGVARAWPVLVVLGFLGLWSLVRVNDSYERASLNIRTSREAKDASVAQARFAKQQSEQQMLKSQMEAARLQVLQQHPNAKIISQKFVPPVVATDDIHELMDQFDQPQIPVSPEPPKPPSPPAPTAAPPVAAVPAAPAPTAVVAITAGSAAEGTASISVEAKKTDTKKTSAAGQKRKKPKPSSDGAKPAVQATAASNANKESQAHKESAAKETKAVAEDPVSGPTKSQVRPAWVDQPAKRVGGDAPREVIVTDLWSTEMECERKRDMLLMVKVFEHMQRMGLAPELDLQAAMDLRPDGNLYGTPSAGSTHSPQYDQVRNYLSGLRVTLEYARRETAKDEYLEKVDGLSVGPMLKLYTLVEFSPAVDHELRRRWETRERTEGFKVVGVGAVLLLGLLGSVFGLLKIDTWTKGYYTKRLFIGVPATIIAGFLLAALIAAKHVIYR